MHLLIGPLVASPVYKQASVINSSLVNLLVHAAHRIIQINIPRPPAELGWYVAGIDAKHRNILPRGTKLNSNRDAERIERRLGYAIADVCPAIVCYAMSQLVPSGGPGWLRDCSYLRRMPTRK